MTGRIVFGTWSFGQTGADPFETLHPPLRRRSAGDIWEELFQIVARDAPQAEDFDAGRVDHSAAEIEGIPPRRRRRVHALVGIAADRCDAQVQLGLDRVDQAALSDA